MSDLTEETDKLRKQARALPPSEATDCALAVANKLSYVVNAVQMMLDGSSDSDPVLLAAQCREAQLAAERIVEVAAELEEALPKCSCGMASFGVLPDGSDICRGCCNEEDEVALEIWYPWYRKQQALTNALIEFSNSAADKGQKPEQRCELCQHAKKTMARTIFRCAIDGKPKRYTSGTICSRFEAY